MTKTRVLQEIRQMRYEELLRRRQGSGLTQEETAELLGVNVRTLRRWDRRYDETGAEGLVDRRLDRLSARRAPVDEVMEVLNLFETRYSNFTVKHFHEKYTEAHGGGRSYTWVKKQLQESGLVNKAKRKGAHRRRRERKPLTGMMLHQDGSTHEWVEGVQWDLILTLEDATGEVYSGFFVEEEGTFSSFRGVQEVIEAHGLFNSLYTDRGSHYWYTEQAGDKVDKTRPTQFHRALQQLGVELIPAYSPEARGRSERAFRTFQDRLPKELALAGITEMDQANEYLKATFIPDYNRRFSVPAKEEGTAFVPWIGPHLSDILCVQEQRTVANDNTVRYCRRILQIPKDTHRYHYVKVKVRVHEYIDGSLAIFHGPRCLGRYDPGGNLSTTTTTPQAAVAT